MTAVLSPTDALRRDLGLGSMDDSQINYSSSSVDWRAKYNEVADMLADTRAELDDFHHSSKELEEELERELERTEKAQQDLQIKVDRAENERDEWKSKFMSLQTTHNTTTTSLQRELDKLRQDHQAIKIQLRDLEMGNDDLERNERAVASELKDEQAKYSRVLEEKILLEHELLEKANVEEECQRLKDELRDAYVEVSILKDQLAVSHAASATVESLIAPSAIFPAPGQSGDDLLATTPPDDLQLSELSPDDPLAMPSTPKQISRHVSTQSNQNDTLRASKPLTASGIARSSTLPVLTSPSRIPPRAPPIPRPIALRNPSTASNGTGTTSRSKGVQMVSDMRARVRVLEQKIHTRVPRLRMGSLNGRPSPSSAITSPTTNFTPSSQTNNPRASLSREHRGKRSIESLVEKKLDKPESSSGWVLIMEDSPSPVKVKMSNKEKDRERRRASSPLSGSAYRPRTSASGMAAPTASNPEPSKRDSLSQSAIQRRSSSRQSASSATTSSYIPTPSSRPSTPTFLPPPSAGFHSNSSAALKRSAPPAAMTTLQKRASLGSHNMDGRTFNIRERDTRPSSTMLPPPRSSVDNTVSTPSIYSSRSISSLSDRGESSPKVLPRLPIGNSNVTMRPPSKVPASSILSKSRIGRPSGGSTSSSGIRSGRSSSDFLNTDPSASESDEGTKSEMNRSRSASSASTGMFGFGKSRNGR